MEYMFDEYDLGVIPFAIPDLETAFKGQILCSCVSTASLSGLSWS